MDLDEAAKAFRDFLAVIKALRTPVTGCPWDLKQTHQTLRPYLLEEAHEVLDAIDRIDDAAFQEELGDLLLQVVLHAQLADDRGAFSMTEVIGSIREKMVRRHPHVFGSVQVSDADEVSRNWEQIKAAERQESGESAQAAALARVPLSLPALLRAQQLGVIAARGQDDQAPVADLLGIVRQQFTALEAEVRAAGHTTPEQGERVPEEVRARLEQELGALLFGLCRLAQRLDLSAEDSLRAATNRFVERSQHQEQPNPPERR